MPGRRTILHAAVLLGAAILAACSERSPAPAAPATAGAIEAVCTTGMVADVVRNIGGERVQVAALMGEGVDPHLYKASPADVRLLSDATIVFYSGLHLEGKMGEILEQLGRSKPVVAIGEHVDHARLMSPPGAAGVHDPHIWFDVSLWAQTIPAVREALVRIDPAHKDAYAARADQYSQRLEALHMQVQSAMVTIPQGSRVLVTAHDAFGYFARAYGLEVHAIQGISTESEAALKDINNLVDLLVSRKVPAVFVESSVPRKNIEALVEGCAARGHTVTIGGELFSDAMGKPGTDEGTYPGMVMHNVNTIVKALGGS